MPDYVPASTATTAGIAVGGSVGGVLETAGDHDWYRITLAPGQSVTILLSGTGATPVTDPYLYLRDASGNIITEDDDGGAGLGSRIIFTSETGGTFYIDAGSYDNAYTGNFELSVSNYVAPVLSVYTNDQIADWLTAGFWGGSEHRFNVTQGGTITVNLTALTAAGQNLATNALALWSDIIGITFAPVATGGMIVFDDDEEGAFADAVHSGGITSSATVNVSTDWLVDNGTALNSYSFQTYIHEIGHALGLGHGGDYNGDASYAVDAMYLNDSWATTVMSYFDQSENSYFSNLGFTRDLALTPMMADIVAIQSLYGAATTTRTGNTTYGFNSTANRSIFNATQNGALTNAFAYVVVDNGGSDTLDYSGYANNQLIDLNPETFSNVGNGVGNVSIARGTIIENAIGGSGNDTLVGNAANNVLNGGGGTDTASYAAAAAAVTVDLANLAAQNTIGAGSDTLGGFENLAGSAFNDTLGGNAAANTVTGGSGNDTLTGAAGNDAVNGDAGDDVLEGGAGDDVLNGGAGNDTASYAASTAAVTVSLALGAQNTGGAGTDTLVAIEHVSGSAFNDTLTGNGGANTLSGNAGNDTLIGGAGADSMAGGAGNDWFYVDAAADAIVEAAGGGTDRVLSAVTYALNAGSAVELVTTTNAAGTGALNLTGNEFAQTIAGNAGANILDGRGGADTLIGYGGNDSYFVDHAADAVTEAASAGTDRVLAAVSYALAAGANVEVLTTTFTAGTTAINLTGNALAQTIHGNAGVNTLNGGGGADTLVGFAGNDFYHVDTAADIVTEAAGGGVDRVFTTVSYTLNASTQVEILSASVAAATTAINLTGNGFAQTLTGNAGANILNGAGGADQMVGYGGDDWFYVDNAADSIVEAASGGTADRVLASTSYTLNAGAHVEILTTTNTAGSAALNLSGNDLGQRIVGNAGANQLAGGGGNDVLTGAGGADSFRFDSLLNAASNVDSITDFAAVDDSIALDQSVFAALPASGTLSAAAFHAGTAAADADHRIVYDSATGR
ncbi:M10 family metallopeptidase C-terminal domain-containing protein, partial [Sphingomonas sp.]|uniref:M10 family metallopeptidase C-terminal domain-containing protein n=1 Tax=Sphingomonas sp. TaxID=28214 RepID=UPI00286D6B7D